MSKLVSKTGITPDDIVDAVKESEQIRSEFQYSTGIFIPPGHIDKIVLDKLRDEAVYCVELSKNFCQPPESYSARMKDVTLSRVAEQFTASTLLNYTQH